MKYQINLLPKREQTSIDKITYFALHYLRYILVITQLVAIGVFFYRFKVDQDIVDLKDTLTQKKAIVDNTQELLKSVKDIDTKIKNVKGLYTKQDHIEKEYLYVIAKVPPDIKVQTVSVDPDGIKFSGEALAIETVRLFYEQIREEKLFKLVNLSNINKSETGFTFDLTLSGFITQNGP
jgi:Tfp pilus assembly protein PilN